jgi:phytoene dehydrogenase-like protein
MRHADVLIVGAGLAGLACARELGRRGIEPVILEASDAPGGRIRTDRVGGFLLDRGFQVLQTWYPEARRQLDYAALDLRAFAPGAVVRVDGAFHRVTDVWRRPSRVVATLAAPVGTLGDKLRLARLRTRALRGTVEALYVRPETTAPDLLRQLGFSSRMMERFFEPFFAGVFFEPQIRVSSRTFEFIFRAFALGDTALPALGMQAIPDQLAADLPEGSLRLGTRVAALTADGAMTDDGQRWSARARVLAVDPWAAARLLGGAEPPARGTTCLYFAAGRPPFPGPDLVLNATGRGPVNSLTCPTNLSPAYAPAGQALVGVNLPGVHRNLPAARAAALKQLREWYGAQVDRWEPLADYPIERGLPAQAPPVSDPARRRLRLAAGLWSCGEDRGEPSIHWALATGRRCAVEIAAHLGAGRG